MDLSVIIVNWNTCHLLIQCLISIYDYPNDFEIEVIVIDNASSDESVAMVRHGFPHVLLIENEHNVGFARANNQGLALAQGRYVMLLNSDTVIQPTALTNMVRFADYHNDAGIIGCKLLNEDGSLQESWASFPSLWSELTGRNLRRRRLVDETTGAYEVDWVGGACLLARAAALKKVGFLDDSYFMYSEETDWCFRVRQQGWTIYYLSEAEVIHLGGGSASRTSLTQLVRLYDSKIHFFDKHYGRWSAFFLRYGLAIVNTLGLARRVLSWSLAISHRREISQRLKIQGQLIWHLLQ